MMNAFKVYKSYCEKCQRETDHYLNGGCVEEPLEFIIQTTNTNNIEWIKYGFDNII